MDLEIPGIGRMGLISELPVMEGRMEARVEIKLDEPHMIPGCEGVYCVGRFVLRGNQALFDRAALESIPPYLRSMLAWVSRQEQFNGRGNPALLTFVAVDARNLRVHFHGIPTEKAGEAAFQLVEAAMRHFAQSGRTVA